MSSLSGINSSSSQYQTSAMGGKQEPKEPPAEIKQKLLAAGVPESTIAQGKEAVKSYVDSHPEVKAKLDAEKGDATAQPAGAQTQGSIFAQNPIQNQNSTMSATNVDPNVGKKFEAVA